MKHRTLPHLPTHDMIEAAYPLIDAMPHESENRKRRLVKAIYEAMWSAGRQSATFGLTKNQTKVHIFIAQFNADHGRSPSNSEIAKNFNMSYRSEAHSVVKALERKKVLIRGAVGQRNNIQLQIQPGERLPKIKK